MIGNPRTYVLQDNNEVRDIVFKHAIATTRAMGGLGKNLACEHVELHPNTIFVYIPKDKCSSDANTADIVQCFIREFYAGAGLVGVREHKPFQIIRRLDKIPFIDTRKYKRNNLTGQRYLALHENVGYAIDVYVQESVGDGILFIRIEIEPLLRDVKFASYCPITPKLILRHSRLTTSEDRKRCLEGENTHLFRWKEYFIHYKLVESDNAPKIDFFDFTHHVYDVERPVDFKSNGYDGQAMLDQSRMIISNVSISRIHNEISLHPIHHNDRFYREDLPSPLSGELLLGWWHTIVRHAHNEYRKKNSSKFYFDEVK